MTARAHFGDPCVKCGSAHDDVQPGACPGRPTPWGDAWGLGRTHAMCGMSRINPEFFKHPLDRSAYVAGYDGRGNQ
jgi:hypothetical protein